jgi:hypothetical protein
MSKHLMIVLLIVAVLAAVPAALAQEGVTETPLQVIEISGPAAEPDAEISSLAWYGDYLLLMAENPNIYADMGDVGKFFALDKADILAYLEADEPEALTPMEVPISADVSIDMIPGFDGFEAIAFADNQVFLLIEAQKEDESMIGYLVRGTVESNLGGIKLDLENLVEIEPQTEFGNMCYESLLVIDDRLVALYEVNGAAANAAPVGYTFNFDLEAQGAIAMDYLEYRLTDATTLDEDGMFWVINYFFPGEDFLAAEVDPLVEMYGEGPTHAEYDGVERLVAMQVAEEGIVLVETAPIQLEMLGVDTLRNLEGIARLDDLGLLVVTDKYPETILGFVPLPAAE